MSAPGPGGLLILGVPGTSLGSPERGVLEEVRPGGVILFGHNVDSIDQVRELVAEIRRVVPEVVLFADAEGGRVDRFRELFGRAPAAGALARTPPRRAEQSGRWIGHAFRALGIDADFAPVVDLDHGAEDNALGGRYLGGDPRRVASRARAFLRGLGSAGIGGCLKHFPGLGAATADTHHEPAAVGLSREALERDLRPFRELASGVAAAMVSHAIYPGIDSERRPASLSPVVVGDLLRRELGFEGLVVTDDLDMQALAPWGDVVERTLLSVEAGCDAPAICHSWREAPRAVELLRTKVPRERIARSLDRWARYRQRLEDDRDRIRRFSVETIRRRLAALRRAVGEVGSRDDPTMYRAP